MALLNFKTLSILLVIASVSGFASFEGFIRYERQP